MPQRVVTLAPHLTELVFAAGAGARERVLEPPVLEGARRRVELPLERVAAIAPRGGLVPTPHHSGE